MREKLLSAALLLWIVGTIAICVPRIFTLGNIIEKGGPQALGADARGGFFLATNGELLHFDDKENLVARRSAESLGLRNLNSLASDNSGHLWIYDADLRQPFRCDQSSWHCEPFGPHTLSLDANVQMALSPSPESHLLISDNTHNRVLLLDSNGKVLNDGHGMHWAVPNQITATPQGFLLADTGRYRIAGFNDPTETGTTIMNTQWQPYHFVQRGQQWWVVESGSSLNNGHLEYYDQSKHVSRHIATQLHDVIAVTDTGSRIIVADKAGWALQGIDPDTGDMHPIGSSDLQREFSAKGTERQAAIHERSLLPAIMIALMAPALLGGMFLQRRMDAAAKPPTVPPKPSYGAEVATPHAFANPPSLKPDMIRITPDPEGLENYRLRLKLLKPLVAIMFLGLLAGGGITLLAPYGRANLLFVLSIETGLVVAAALGLYLAYRRMVRTYTDLSLVCTPQKVFLLENNKPVLAVPFDEIWLSSSTLVLGDRKLRLYLQLAALTRKMPGKIVIWSETEIQELIGTRLPAGQIRQSLLGLMAGMGQKAPGRMLATFWQEIALIALVLFVLAWRISDISQQYHRIVF